MTQTADTGKKVTQPELVTLTIDGTEITVPKGTLVIRAAELIGVQIPRFCDHPLLDPVGACRQCIVDARWLRLHHVLPFEQAMLRQSVGDGLGRVHRRLSHHQQAAVLTDVVFLLRRKLCPSRIVAQPFLTFSPRGFPCRVGGIQLGAQGVGGSRNQRRYRVGIR